VRAGCIITREEFGDRQLHIEWRAPSPAKGDSQGRGNSGIFLMGLYETQVLDCYHNLTYADGQAGAVYGQSPPLVNACRPPGEWQTYDIVYTAPRFKDGKIDVPGFVTTFHNGVLVQNHTQIQGPPKSGRARLVVQPDPLDCKTTAPCALSQYLIRPLGTGKP
jgi:hypothetical protein